MKMRELCNRSVVIAEPEETVQQAARRMREHHVGCLIVVDRRDGVTKPIAIVTDRDLVVGALTGDRAQPLETTLTEVMSSPLVAASEDEELYDVIHRMRARGVRRVPIIDGEGRLQGVYTFDDVLEYLSEELEGLSALLRREQSLERERR